MTTLEQQINDQAANLTLEMKNQDLVEKLIEIEEKNSRLIAERLSLKEAVRDLLRAFEGGEA